MHSPEVHQTPRPTKNSHSSSSSSPSLSSSFIFALSFPFLLDFLSRCLVFFKWTIMKSDAGQQSSYSASIENSCIAYNCLFSLLLIEPVTPLTAFKNCFLAAAFCPGHVLDSSRRLPAILDSVFCSVLDIIRAGRELKIHLAFLVEPLCPLEFCLQFIASPVDSCNFAVGLFYQYSGYCPTGCEGVRSGTVWDMGPKGIYDVIGDWRGSGEKFLFENCSSGQWRKVALDTRSWSANGGHGCGVRCWYPANLYLG